MNASMTYKYVGLWKRFLAGIIDSIFLMIPFGIGVAFLSKISIAAVSIFTLLMSILIIAYWITLPVIMGGTLGKRLLGIRVISYTGENLTYKESFIRYLPFFIYGVLNAVIEFGGTKTLGSLLGLVYLIFIIVEVVALVQSETKQAVHDAMAGSCVVED